MSTSARWALSPLDCQVHLLVPTGDHPWGVPKARCGHVLLAGVHAPARGAHRCSTCAEIAKRPFLVLAAWAARSQAADDPVAAAGRPTIARALWANCRIDERLHLLSARAVLEFAALGCAVASCGTLVITQELVLRGVGTPCTECLIAGCA